MAVQKKEGRSFRSRLSNFWYYYKWYTIVITVLVVTVAFSTVQCATAEKFDYTLLLACSDAGYSNAQIIALQQELSVYAEDLNGDGKANVRLLDCTYNPATAPRDLVLAQRQKLQTQLMNNSEALLILTDDSCFHWLNSITDGGFMADIGLPLDNGRSFDLDTHNLFTRAKQQCSSNLTWSKNLKISRRIVKDTLIERDKKIQNHLDHCNAFLNRVTEDKKLSQKTASN